MLTIKASEPTSWSEKRFRGALAGHGGVAVLNFVVGRGSGSREVDALVVTPEGCVVVEVKGTSKVGEVTFSDNWPWQVDGAVERFGLKTGNPATQASLNAKLTKAVLARKTNPGFVEAVVALDGPPGFGVEAEGHFVGGACVMTVEAITSGLALRPVRRRSITIEQVFAILDALEVPGDMRPSGEDLAREGFAPSAGGTPVPPSRREMRAAQRRERTEDGAASARLLTRKTESFKSRFPRWARPLLFVDPRYLKAPVLLPVYMLPMFAVNTATDRTVYPDWVDMWTAYAVATFAVGSLIWLAGALRARLGAFTSTLDVAALFAYPICVESAFLASGGDRGQGLASSSQYFGWGVAFAAFVVVSALFSHYLVEEYAAREVRRRKTSAPERGDQGADVARDDAVVDVGTVENEGPATAKA